MTGGLSISGARVFTPGRNLGVATVRIEDGRIVAVGADVRPSAGDRVVDAGGLALLPGFVDIHSHGRGGCDFCDATDAAFDTIGRGKLADGVEAGKAPEAVKKLADKFVKSIGWKAEASSSAKATEDKVGDVAWFLDDTTAADKAVVAATKKLFAAAKVSPKIITGGSIGKALKVLGFLAEAKMAAGFFAEFLKKEGVKTLIVSNPAAASALKQDYPEFGVKLPCDVKCVAGFIASSKIKFTKAAGEVYPLADDFLRNYLGCGCMEKLLAAVKAVCRPFGTNDEETYNCGEGAVVLDKLHPELVKKLAEYVAARADNPKKDKIVVASAYVKRVLVKYGKLNVVTLEELAASCL